MTEEPQTDSMENPRRPRSSIDPGGHESRSRVLHERSEGHRGRAHRFTRTALDTRLHVVHEGTLGCGDERLHTAHRVDPAPRRCRLLTGDPERRAVRETQTAVHARRQSVRVESERCSLPHGSLSRHRGRHRGSLPGENFLVGSKASRIRCITVCAGKATPKGSMSPPPCSLSIQPPDSSAMPRA